jgi:hypothetical protein
MRPLKRLPYFVGQVGLWLLVVVFFGILRLMQYPLPPAVGWAFYVMVALSFLVIAYSLAFSLRRLIDIGIHSWNAAFIVNYALANAVSHLSAVYPLPGITLFWAYYLLMFLVPTGVASKKEVEPSAQAQ